jgi:hypothetical protein
MEIPSCRQVGQVLPLGDLLIFGFSALIAQINDGKDFREYVMNFSEKMPKGNGQNGPPANEGDIAGAHTVPFNGVWHHFNFRGAILHLPRCLSYLKSILMVIEGI